MRLVLDACSLINLNNGSAFATVLSLPEFEWNVGPLVLQECGQLHALLDAVTAGTVHELDDCILGANAFTALRRKYRLGLGETECLAFGSALGLSVCTDDGRARKAVATELGPTRLIGSIGLLKSCVVSGLLNASMAYKLYDQMLAGGAFLPLMAEADFQVI